MLARVKKKKGRKTKKPIKKEQPARIKVFNCLFFLLKRVKVAQTTVPARTSKFPLIEL